MLPSSIVRFCRVVFLKRLYSELIVSSNGVASMSGVYVCARARARARARLCVCVRACVFWNFGVSLSNESFASFATESRHT